MAKPDPSGRGSSRLGPAGAVDRGESLSPDGADGARLSSPPPSLADAAPWPSPLEDVNPESSPESDSADASSCSAAAPGLVASASVASAGASASVASAAPWPLSLAASPLPAGSSEMTASLAPTSTVSPSCTRISAR